MSYRVVGRVEIVTSHLRGSPLPLDVMAVYTGKTLTGVPCLRLHVDGQLIELEAEHAWWLARILDKGVDELNQERLEGKVKPPI